MTEGKKRGRPPMTDEQKAEAKAKREAAKANGAGHNSDVAYTEDEKFNALVECDVRIREAERAHKETGENLKAEREVLAKAFGGAAVARKKLDLFRRAQTDEGQAEARAMIDMHQRVAAWQQKPVGYIEDMFTAPAAQSEMSEAA